MWKEIYSPSFFVEIMHSFPHLSATFSFMPSDFDIEYGSPIFNSYTKSLTTGPIALMIVGVLLIITLQLLISCRALLHCCKCAPEPTYLEPESYYDWVYSVVLSKRVLLALFIFFNICSCISDNIILILGMPFVKVGTDQAVLNIGSLQSTFGNAIDHTKSLAFAGSQLTDVLTSSLLSCQYSNLLLPASKNIESALSDIQTILFPVNHRFDEWITNLKNWTEVNFAAFMYTLYIGIGVVNLAISWAKHHRNVLMLKMSIVFTEIIMVFITCTVCLQLVFLIGLADFCMAPVTNSLKMLPFDPFRDITYYFCTCDGRNPFTERYDECQSNLIWLNSTLYDLMRPGHGACTANANEALVKAFGLLVKIRDLLDDFNADVLGDCPAFSQVQKHWKLTKPFSWQYYCRTNSTVSVLF